MIELKPMCPDHKTEMLFSSTNVNPWNGETIIVRGKAVPNKFHYCRTEDCNWRYSTELGEYFKATEI